MGYGGIYFPEKLQMSHRIKIQWQDYLCPTYQVEIDINQLKQEKKQSAPNNPIFS